MQLDGLSVGPKPLLSIGCQLNVHRKRVKPLGDFVLPKTFKHAACFVLDDDPNLFLAGVRVACAERNPPMRGHRSSPS